VLIRLSETRVLFLARLHQRAMSHCEAAAEFGGRAGEEGTQSGGRSVAAHLACCGAPQNVEKKNLLNKHY
jgi:hypothetical protein